VSKDSQDLSAEHATVPMGTEVSRALATPDERPRIALLIYHRDGVQVAPLVQGDSLIIGRARPSDVVISDNRLSAQHACVTWIEETIWLEDLQSTNGTWVDGLKIDRCEVQAGAQLRFGATSASIHTSSEGAQATGLDSHDRFMSELAAEISRSREHRHELAVLMICSHDPVKARAHVDGWIEEVRAQLRSYDRLALYSNQQLELLLPQLGLDKAAALATKLAQSSMQLRCAVGVFPDHGGSAEALIELLRVALKQCSTAEPIHLAGCAPTSGRPSYAPPNPKLPLSPAMKEVYRLAERVASSTIPVLIRGETGSGKEVVARAIHERGKRSAGPMVCVNCGALPGQLVESTLFGHVRGAFTGATTTARGVFEAAAGGTVFLDEIGELPAAAQAALLRVLETKRITRVGSTEEIEIDVRVVAATHRELEAMVAEKSFREDLLFRLNAFTVEVPPLRDCQEDIARLARHFLEQANQSADVQVKGIDEGALAAMHAYHWPGNVRELRNAIERAVVLATDGVVTTDDLPRQLREAGTAVSEPKALTPQSGGAGKTIHGEHLDQQAQLSLIKAARRHSLKLLPLSAEARDALAAMSWNIEDNQLASVMEAGLIRASASGANEVEGVHLFPTKDQPGDQLSFQDATRAFQKQLLSHTLARTGWNVSEASRRLQLSRSRLNELLRSFELKRPG